METDETVWSVAKGVLSFSSDDGIECGSDVITNL
jgi:hypothetical protein